MNVFWFHLSSKIINCFFLWQKQDICRHHCGCWEIVQGVVCYSFFKQVIEQTIDRLIERIPGRLVNCSLKRVILYHTICQHVC